MRTWISRDFIGALSSYNGWRASLRRPGLILWTCSGTEFVLAATPKLHTLAATPNLQARWIIHVEVQRDADCFDVDGIVDVEWQPGEVIAPESYIRSVAPMLDRLYAWCVDVEVGRERPRKKVKIVPRPVRYVMGEGPHEAERIENDDGTITIRMFDGKIFGHGNSAKEAAQHLSEQLGRLAFLVRAHEGDRP